MTKPKSEQKPKPSGELPLGNAPGVAKLVIDAIDKAVSKYERKKEARCAISPAEVAAKDELLQALHDHRDKLPKNEDGNFFYRYEGVDYVLEESLKRKKVEAGDGGVD